MRVSGSAKKPYAVDIGLEYSGDRLVDIEGECTCPVSLNCKHVAATLLEALNGRTAPARATLPARGPAARGEATPAAPVLPLELNDWLEKVGTAIRGDDYPPEVVQRLLYCVQPQAREGRMPHLALSVMSTRLRKDGGFANQVSRPNLSSVNLENPPAYYRAADVDIVRGLAREYRSYAGRDVVYLVRDAELLRRIVDTGRAYWRDLEAKPMRMERNSQRSSRMAPDQSEGNRAASAGRGGGRDGCGTTGLCRRGRKPHRASGITDAREPGVSDVVGATRPTRTGRRGGASSRTTIAGRSPRSAAGPARCSDRDRRGSDTRPAPPVEAGGSILRLHCVGTNAACASQLPLRSIRDRIVGEGQAGRVVARREGP